MKKQDTLSAPPAVTPRERFIQAARKPISLYLLCFLLPVGIMYLAYSLFRVHPYGDGSVLVLDLNGQYVYYYEAYRKALLGGGSLIYDWSRNLSGNMFGIFAYYLASPFMILVCIFPRTAMCGAIETIQLLKIGSAAVTFAYYLRLTARRAPKNTSVVIFSMMYSLMSYMIVQLMDPMWLDGLIYLPLICAGVHRLIHEGKMLPYIIPLTLMFIAHFYIGYMVGFFTLCYFLYCIFCEDTKPLSLKTLGRCLRFGGGTLTAILASSWVLLPVYNALKLGKLEFTEPDWSMATQFDFLTFITKLFPMSYDTVYPEGLPMIFCGAAAVMLLPLYFLNRGISAKRKTLSGVLLVLLTVFMYIRPVDMVWHGFQMPNWLPFRYSFAFSFVMLVMAFEAFENLDGVTVKEIGGVFFGLLIFLFWCERENYAHFEIFRSVTEKGETKAVIGGIWFSMIALCVYFLLLCLNKKHCKTVLCVVTCAAVGIELLANCMDTLQKIDDDVAYSKYTSYEPYMSNTIGAVEHIKTFDGDPFYRIEASFHRTVNDPIGTGYMGISHSSSVMNAPALTMLHQLGYAYGGHYTKYDGTTLITDSIFDIRYLMTKEEQIKKLDEDGEEYFEYTDRFNDSRIRVPSDYTLATSTGFEDNTTKAEYFFYRNPYSIGLGAVCGDNINSLELSDVDPFGNQNILYSALSGADHIEQFFTRIYPESTEGFNMSTAPVSENHIKYYATHENADNPHMDYLIRMDKDSDLYMYFPTKYERNCNVWILDEESYIAGDGLMDFAGQFFVGDNYSILDLGSFLKDEEVRVRVTIDNEDNEAYWSDSIFCTFDKQLFIEAAQRIQSRSFTVTSFDNTSLSGECTADTDGEYLFTTIPYEPGWVVTVNGSRVTTEKCADALITIPLEKGSNHIEMRFEPTYYTWGIVVSIAGVLAIVVILLLEYKDGKLITSLILRAERDSSEVKPEGGAPDTGDHDNDDSDTNDTDE